MMTLILCKVLANKTSAILSDFLVSCIAYATGDVVVWF
jgi:hypothetical protein